MNQTLKEFVEYDEYVLKTTNILAEGVKLLQEVIPLLDSENYKKYAKKYKDIGERLLEIK